MKLKHLALAFAISMFALGSALAPSVVAADDAAPAEECGEDEDCADNGGE